LRYAFAVDFSAKAGYNFNHANAVTQTRSKFVKGVCFLMTRHLYTIKATASELTAVLNALSRALAEADSDVFEADYAVKREDSTLNRSYLRLANSYLQEVTEARNLFLDLMCAAEDEEGNCPEYQEAM